MREVRHHRLSRAARLALCAGGLGAVWVCGAAILGPASDARADDGRGARAAVGPTGATGAVSIDIPPPPLVDSLISGAGLPPLPDIPDLPGLDDLTGSDLPDLPDLPDLTVPDLPGVSLPPVVPQLPTLPDLPPTSIDGDLPALLPLAPETDPASAAVRSAPSPLREGSVPARDEDAPLRAPWAFDAVPVTPPAAPAPPTPSQTASSSSFSVPPPSADRTSSPQAHIASFLNVSPPGRGPPTGPSQDVDTSPD